MLSPPDNLCARSSSVVVDGVGQEMPLERLSAPPGSAFGLHPPFPRLAGERNPYNCPRGRNGRHLRRRPIGGSSLPALGDHHSDHQRYPVNVAK
jgi:hypothetical protein